MITRFDKEREVSASISAVVVIHPPAGQRVTPGLILGVTNQRARDRTVYTPISIPEGVDPQLPSVVGRTESSSRNIGGPTIGGPTRDRGDASPVDRSGCALRLRLDR